MTNVDAVLRAALKELEAERNRIDGQILALRTALGKGAGAGRGRPPGQRSGVRPRRRPRGNTAKRRGPRQFTAAQKKAVSRRMKAYWAKRKTEK